ncbi:MAG: sulfotransferase [Bacteroidetes bacterium]|nr:sulfotransferase [Bacteroidota bacterium]
MYNIKIFIKLLVNTFSFNKSSLRFFSWKRIFAVLLFYPFFAITFVINWIFLLLDELIFPSYRRIKIEKAVFIIGVPRSATTYLFNVLSQDSGNFHCFKLWELVFAPAISQKYVFKLIISIDKLIGKPLYKLSIMFDNIVFGKFREIHDIGLTKPEEDEVLFLYNFSSIYFYYFYPELDVLDHFLYHDSIVPEPVKKRNINFYFRCIQRHNYVFDRQGKKYFLSKNPTFIPKMESIAKRFDQAKFIYPIRSPFQTIPSTISLNARIYANFANLPVEYPFADKTRQMLIKWYQQADKVIRELSNDRTIQVFYQELMLKPETVFADIFQFLQIEVDSKEEIFSLINFNKKNYSSKHQYKKDIGIDKNEINSELSEILTKEIVKKI